MLPQIEKNNCQKACWWNASINGIVYPSGLIEYSDVVSRSILPKRVLNRRVCSVSYSLQITRTSCTCSLPTKWFLNSCNQFEQSNKQKTPDTNVSQSQATYTHNVTANHTLCHKSLIHTRDSWSLCSLYFAMLGVNRYIIIYMQNTRSNSWTLRKGS